VKPIIGIRAEAFALAIDAGLMQAGLAVQWACDLLADELTTDEGVVEVAGLANDAHPLDVAAALRKLARSPGSDRSFREALGLGLSFIRDQPRRWPDVTLALENLATRGLVPDEISGECLAFDDRRRLAEEGVYGDVNEVRLELLSFLERESVQHEPITSREIYAALVSALARQEYWERWERFDYAPEMVSVVFHPQSDGKSTAMYFAEEKVIEIYRAGLETPIDSEVANAAGQASDPISELIFFAHEVGHHLCVLLGLGSAVFDATRPRQTYREETLAWLLARQLLTERFFGPWHEFEQNESQSLEGYRADLGLSPADAALLRREALQLLSERVPANSGLQQTWRSLTLAPRS
jgi:hypothetical protein